VPTRASIPLGRHTSQVLVVLQFPIRCESGGLSAVPFSCRRPFAHGLQINCLTAVFGSVWRPVKGVAEVAILPLTSLGHISSFTTSQQGPPASPPLGPCFMQGYKHGVNTTCSQPFPEGDKGALPGAVTRRRPENSHHWESREGRPGAILQPLMRSISPGCPVKARHMVATRCACVSSVAGSIV
jgi:hypothetical protein